MVRSNTGVLPLPALPLVPPLSMDLLLTSIGQARKAAFCGLVYMIACIMGDNGRGGKGGWESAQRCVVENGLVEAQLSLCGALNSCESSLH